ncbi:conserved hypothetical protein, membrane [Candidatus Magnetomorum sp. HK-1]|nr:conserved hypothetical protein, membrane [Candidatus Magnetomorum sp. HK-1]
MKKLFQTVFLGILIITTNNFVFAKEPSQQINFQIIDRLSRIEEGQKAIIIEMQKRFEVVDKRFEMILREMNIRFEAVDKRFEAIDKRFEAVDKRFESLIREMNQRFEAVNKRFEAVDKRFEAMLREMSQRFESVDKRIESVDKRIESVDKRIESVDKRIESVDKRIDQLGNYIIAMIGTLVSIFIAIISYVVWDRNKILEKIQENFSEQMIHNHKKQVHFSPINAQEKLNQVIDIMKQMSEKFPEMKNMMHAAQLL